MSETEATPLNEDKAEAAKAAVKSFGQKVKDLAIKILSSGTSIRSYAIIVSMVMIVNTLFTAFSHVLGLSLHNVVTDIYILSFGIVCFIMEADKVAIPYGETVRNFLDRNVHFVKNASGRGILYIGAGALDAGQDDHLSTITGTIMMFIGAAYVYLGYSARQKFDRLRKDGTISESARTSAYAKIDSDGDGAISFFEFKSYMDELGSDLNMKEVELLFIAMDKNFDHGVSVEEFNEFWDAENVEV